MATQAYLSTVPPAVPNRARRALLKTALATFVLGLLIWSWVGTEMNLLHLFDSGPRIADFLGRMLPPDLTWQTTEPDDADLGTAGVRRPFPPPLRIAAAVVGVTLQIALLGTALGTAAALALGLLGAENLTPHWVHHPIKIGLALLRSIPVILLALLFVAALGLGPLAGVLAIAIHSIGMLGKLFAEECETADPGVWEATDSAGSNWFQKVRYAVWPQVAPQIYSLTLFRLDMNLRESAVLGLVGVAGLGLAIENYRAVFDYPSVATLVIITMLVVLVVDQMSVHLRRLLK